MIEPSLRSESHRVRAQSTQVPSAVIRPSAQMPNRTSGSASVAHQPGGSIASAARSRSGSSELSSATTPNDSNVISQDGAGRPAAGSGGTSRSNAGPVSSSDGSSSGSGGEAAPGGASNQREGSAAPSAGATPRRSSSPNTPLVPSIPSHTISSSTADCRSEGI